MRNICPNSVRKYAQEDLEASLELANKQSGPMTLKDLSYECGDADDVGDYTVYATAIIVCTDLNRKFDFTVEYVVSGDDVFVGGSVSELAESLCDRYDACKAGKDGAAVSAAFRIGKRRIMAADEATDEFSDTVDDLSDTVDDIQDTLDDIDEDDVDIELDNNIANHFIAECDGCHGVFISALVESDQDVSSIHGTCPLCEKETEQQLKWVIKDR